MSEFPTAGEIMRKAKEKGWETEIDERIPHQVNLYRTTRGSQEYVTVRSLPQR